MGVGQCVFSVTFDVLESCLLYPFPQSRTIFWNAYVVLCCLLFSKPPTASHRRPVLFGNACVVKCRAQTRPR
eukprot:1719663-Pyramimonas_sp.AAC.1